MSDLKRAVDTILDRQGHYEEAESYYEGRIGERFASAKFARLFSRGPDYRFNFARTVVDVVVNRTEINAVMGTTQAANSAINRIWEQNEMSLDANEIHRRALMYGDCYVIVWPGADGEIEISYNSPVNTTLVYDPESPRKKLYAAKMWTTTVQNAVGQEVKRTRVNVYYADRIEKFQRDGEIVSGDNNWQALETVDNPFGEVPVFHFRTQRPQGRPEHEDAFGPQDAINKLINMHMNVVDYQGAPQRYALTGNADSQADPFDDDDTERENLGSLKNGPGELWYLNGVTQVGQFTPAESRTFLEPIKEYVRAMASLTNTPLHYFERTGNVPSGEALRTAEAPLLKKVADRQLSFGSTWRDVFRFILRIEGIKADVQVEWKAVESMGSLEIWERAIKMRSVGLPLGYVLETMGIDKELAAELEEKAQAAAATPAAQPGMNAHNLALQQAKQERLNEMESNQ